MWILTPSPSPSFSIQVLNFHIRKCLNRFQCSFGAILFSECFWLLLFYSGGCATGELLFSLVFDGSKNKLREWKRKQSTVADQKSKWELRYVFLCNVCAQHDGYSLQLSKAKKKVNQSVMYIDIVYFDAAHECVHVCTYLHNLHVLCRKVLIEWCAN